MYSLTNVGGLETLKLTANLSVINEEKFSDIVEKHKQRIQKIIYFNQFSFVFDSHEFVSKTIKFLDLIKNLIHFEMEEFKYTNGFDETFAHDIKRFIENCPNLENFIVNRCHFTDYIMSSIVDSFSIHPNIKKIKFIRMDFENSQMSSLSNLLKNKSLISLEIISCRLNLKSLSSLASALISNSTLKSLTIGAELFFESEILTDAIMYISQALTDYSNIQRLTLNSIFLGIDGVLVLSVALSMSSTLTELDLYDTQLGPTGISILNDGLKGNFGLKILNIGNNNIGSSAKDKKDVTASITKILKDAKYLEQLNISYSYIGTPKSLLDAFKATKVSSLRLDGIRFTPHQYFVVMNSLKKNKNMKSLSISLPNSESRYIDQFENFNSLEELIIDNYIVRQEMKLYQVLKSIPRLKSITLRRYFPIDGKLLGAFIGNKKNLKEFTVGKMVELVDFQSIYEGMEQNRTLIEFKGLFDNSIVEKFQCYLQRNRSEELCTRIKEHFKLFEMTKISLHDIKFNFRINKNI